VTIDCKLEEKVEISEILSEKNRLLKTFHGSFTSKSVRSTEPHAFKKRSWTQPRVRRNCVAREENSWKSLSL